MLRRIPVPVYIGGSVLIIVVIIAVVAFFALGVVQDTVVEDLRSEQLSTTRAASLEAEAYFTDLNIEITSLAQQPSIIAPADIFQLQALALSVIQGEVEDREGIVTSVTRFNAQGQPQYAYPERYNGFIGELRTGGTYPYTIPEELLEQVQRRAINQIETSLFRQTGTDQQVRYLLISPVQTTSQSTEFLAYELQMTAIFDTALETAISNVVSSQSAQMWIFDYDDNAETYRSIYAVKNNPSVSTIRDPQNAVFTDADLANLTDTDLRAYGPEDEVREAALATSVAVNRPFIFLISREASEAVDQVTDDLQVISTGSIVAILGLSVIGFLVSRRLVQEQKKLQEESGMRATARSLLEISRALNSTLDIDVVLNRILTEFEDIIPYHSASILLVTENGLEVAAHRGEDEETHKKVFTWEEARAAREVIARGHPVLINDTTYDERWTDVSGVTIKSWVGLPLKVFERSVGVLNINSDELNRFSPQDINLAETFADQASVAIQNARLYQMEVKRIEQELTIARSIQESLQPVSPPEYPDLEFAWEGLAAQQVSGDFFQLVPLTNDQMGVFVGDVSGKGMPAAMIMAVVTTALRDEVNRHRNPGELLNVLNTRLIDRLQQNNMNSALLTSFYSPIEQEFYIANAGMGLPYYRDADGEWTDIEIGGYPLGSSKSASYSGKSIEFRKNSLLVMYSDGIIEAQNWRGEFFGFERLEELLKALPDDVTAQQTLETILEAVQQHLGDEKPQDDITVLVVRSLAEEPVIEEPEEDDYEDERPAKISASSQEWQEKFLSRAPKTYEREGFAMPRENVEVFLPSTLGYEKVARDAAEAIAREMGFTDDRIEDLKTAVAEACMNAIEHGNLEDRSTSVTVLLSASSDSLEIRVEDRGREVIPNPLPPPGGVDQSRGWGLFFIQSLMDDVEFSELPEGGNLVKMTIYLGSEEDGTEETEDDSSEASE